MLKKFKFIFSDSPEFFIPSFVGRVCARACMYSVKRCDRVNEYKNAWYI